ncbi:MAG: ABC transporter permease [Gammaproteobacteria bacterium]|nr:MAG: ABC transporter permease [Gammaproteobacteria bacterium]
MKHFYAIFIARNKEFYRDKASLSWAILFPVLIISLFAFSFADDKPQYKIGVYLNDTNPSASLNTLQDQLKLEFVQWVQQDSLPKAISKVKHHQLDMLITASSAAKPEINYWINDGSAGGYFLEQAMLQKHQSDTLALKRELVSGRAVRYLDWVIPGILAMNMMFGCLFGVGYVIVNYRQNGVLKRLKATPLNAFEFLAAQISSRLIISLTTTSVIFVGANYFFDTLMLGSYLNLLIVATLGAIALISIGLISACRTSSTELSNGILNIISLPMMFLSGVWFSLEGAHPNLQLLAQWLPLTHIVDAARAIMLDGAGLKEIAPQLWALVAISAGALIITPLIFRWDKP